MPHSKEFETRRAICTLLYYNYGIVARFSDSTDYLAEILCLADQDYFEKHGCYADQDYWREHLKMKEAA